MTQLRDRMLEELERYNYSPGAKPGFSDASSGRVTQRGVFG
jgi:hypothetical protein